MIPSHSDCVPGQSPNRYHPRSSRPHPTFLFIFIWSPEQSSWSLTGLHLVPWLGPWAPRVEGFAICPLHALHKPWHREVRYGGDHLPFTPTGCSSQVLGCSSTPKALLELHPHATLLGTTDNTPTHWPMTEGWTDMQMCLTTKPCHHQRNASRFLQEVMTQEGVPPGTPLHV